jgi:hypothetical protein
MLGNTSREEGNIPYPNQFAHTFNVAQRSTCPLLQFFKTRVRTKFEICTESSWLILCLSVSATIAVQAQTDPLPSWNEGRLRSRSIIEFVARVTTGGGPDFVPTPERIATVKEATKQEI